MKISDPLLFDTNVLVYAHNEQSLFHKQALALVSEVVKGNLHTVLAHQNLLELYSIITDKRRVSKPLSGKQAFDLIRNYFNSPFKIIFPTYQTIDILSSVCQDIKIKNGQIFDAYLMATMLSNKIKKLVTANIDDFKYFRGIEVLDLKKWYQN